LTIVVARKYLVISTTSSERVFSLGRIWKT